MRIALLTDDSEQSAYLAAQVAARFDVGLWVIEHPHRGARIRTMLRRRKSIGWSGVLGIILMRIYSRLFETHPRVLPPFEQPRIQPLTVPSINDPRVPAAVREQGCDVCVVLGTTIIRKTVLAQLPRWTLNLHGGLTPWYRGSNCCVWAVINGEPHRAGITWHWVDAGVDTGAVLRQAQLPLQQDDTRQSIFHRQVLIGCPILLEILADLAVGLEPPTKSLPPHSGGRLYFTPPLWTYLRFKRRIRAAAGPTAAPISPPVRQ